MPTPSNFWLKLPSSLSENERIIERGIRELPTGQTLLFRQTLSAAGTFDFQNIPNTFFILRAIVLARSNVAGLTDNVVFTVNNDSAANYWAQQVFAQNATVSATNSYAQNGFVGNCPGNTATAGYFGYTDVTIYNYSSTIMFKLAQVQDGAPSSAATPASDTILYRACFWNNTAAINRLTCKPLNGTNYLAGSTLSVYGVY